MQPTGIAPMLGLVSRISPANDRHGRVAAGRQAWQRIRRRGRVAALLLSVAASVALAPPAFAATASRVERKIVKLVNRQRAQRGLPPVRISGRLVAAARFHSAEMLRYDYFDHASVHPARAWDARVRSYLHRRVVGENLAWGAGTYATAAMTVQMWMASPPHRAIILDGRFRLVGIGRKLGTYAGSSGAMVTADFASSR
jgi:uncharacterized protein YkwD